MFWHAELWIGVLVGICWWGFAGGWGKTEREVVRYFFFGSVIFGSFCLQDEEERTEAGCEKKKKNGVGGGHDENKREEKNELSLWWNWAL